MERSPDKEKDRKEDVLMMVELAREKIEEVSRLLTRLSEISSVPDQADFLRELAVESGGLNGTIENMIKRVHRDIED